MTDDQGGFVIPPDPAAHPEAVGGGPLIIRMPAMTPGKRQQFRDEWRQVCGDCGEITILPPGAVMCNLVAPPHYGEITVLSAGAEFAPPAPGADAPTIVESRPCSTR